MPSSDPQRARALGVSVRGAHPGGRAINQDAFATRVTDTRAMIAVADGHGSPTCFRSEIGAAMAVEIALELGEGLLADLAAIEDESAHVYFARRLVARWRERVLEHAAQHPFEDREFPVGMRAVLMRQPTLAYGSTLIFVAADESRFAYVQIGDGEAIAVSRNGIARTIFTKPAEMPTNETHSLCQDEAWEFVRIDVRQRRNGDPAFVLAATDGFVNAFVSSEAARERVIEFNDALTENDTALSAALDSLAREATGVSGDDVTLAMLIPAPMTIGNDHKKAGASAAPPLASWRSAAITASSFILGAVGLAFAIALVAAITVVVIFAVIASFNATHAIGA